MRSRLLFSLGFSLALTAACGGDDNNDGTEADKTGVGAQCAGTPDCEEYMQDDGETDTSGEAFELICLPQFKGGYCGLEDCTGNDDCPEGAACVAHTDGTNYCFRRCTDKSQCNRNRDPDHESNCSANIDFVEQTSGKACVPPSG